MTLSTFLDGVTLVITGVPWFTVFWIVFTVIMVLGLLRYHRKANNHYDLWDIVMSKGKADLDKHIIVAFAVLSIWVVVWMVQHDKNPETLLLGALGIFVARRIINGVADTVKGVPDDPPEQDVIKVEGKDGSGR